MINTLWFHLHEVPKSSQTHRDKQRNYNCQRMEKVGRENGELMFNGYRVSTGKNEKVLEIDGGDG